MAWFRRQLEFARNVRLPHLRMSFLLSADVILIPLQYSAIAPAEQRAIGAPTDLWRERLCVRVESADFEHTL